MASLESIKLLLFQLRAKLVTNPAFTRFDGGPTVEDPSYNRDWDELSDIGKRLALILRDLKGKENLTSMQTRNALRGPLDPRFRAASIQGGAHDLRMIAEAARTLQKTLEDVVRRNSGPGQAETAKQLSELVEKLYKQAHTHAETIDLSHELRYTPYQQHSEASIEGLLFPIFMLIRALDYLRKQARKRIA